MSLSRRTVLKGTLATGAALGMAALPLHAQARPAGAAVVPLLAGTEADAAFLDGIRRGLAGSDMATSAPLRFAAQTLLTPGASKVLAGRFLVGLISESQHVVLTEIVRGCGGRLLCTGWHTAQAGRLHDSYHRFTAAPAARGIGTALADGLRRAGESFAVHETGIGADHPIGGRPAALGAEGGWMGMTGEALARIAAGSWRPGRAETHSSAGLGAGEPVHRSLVSFVAQI